MPKITLYLDDATQALVEQAASIHGMSKSRWVAEVIRKYAAHEWSKGCLELAGLFAKFPQRDADDAGGVQVDVPRLGFCLSSMHMLDSNTVSHNFRGDAQVVPRLQALRPAHPSARTIR